MPLFMSLPTGAESIPRSSIIGPGTYRLQWDLKFEVTAPVWNGDRVNVKAFGDVIVPMTPFNPVDPSTAILKSRVLRSGIVTSF